MDEKQPLISGSHDSLWQDLCRLTGAELVEGEGWNGDKVIAHDSGWTVTIDNLTGMVNGTPITLTRIRAPFLNHDKFHFTIYRRGPLTDIGKFFGMQDIETGYPDFDEAFVIKAHDELKAIALFGDATLRMKYLQEPYVHITIRDDEGWFAEQFPDGVDELYYSSSEVRDPLRLKSMFELFSATLHRLGHLDSAYEDDPHFGIS